MRTIHAFSFLTCLVCLALTGSLHAQTAESPPQPAAVPPLVVVAGPDTDTVHFDGHVSPFEYLDARQPIQFRNGHGLVQTYVRRAGDYLVFAFELPDRTPHIGDDIVVMLDLENTGADSPQKSCIRAYVRRKMENSRMHVGDGEGWKNLYGDWEYRATAYDRGWEAEVRIPLASIGAADNTVPVKLGLAFRIWDNEPQAKWNWPANADENTPSTWGTLIIPPPEKE